LKYDNNNPFTRFLNEMIDSALARSKLSLISASGARLKSLDDPFNNVECNIPVNENNYG